MSCMHVHSKAKQPNQHTTNTHRMYPHACTNSNNTACSGHTASRALALPISSSCISKTAPPLLEYSAWGQVCLHLRANYQPSAYIFCKNYFGKMVVIQLSFQPLWFKLWLFYATGVQTMWLTVTPVSPDFTRLNEGFQSWCYFSCVRVNK